MEILCLLHIVLGWYLSNVEFVGAELQDQAIIHAINQELKVPEWGDANISDYCTWQGVSCGNHSMVEKLNLAHKNLRGNVTLMSELKSLKLLDLSNNNFGGLIPPDFGSLSELEVLDLSSNKFEGSIPSQFGGLRSLKSLNLPIICLLVSYQLNEEQGGFNFDFDYGLQIRVNEEQGDFDSNLLHLCVSI